MASNIPMFMIECFSELAYLLMSLFPNPGLHGRWPSTTQVYAIYHSALCLYKCVHLHWTNIVWFWLSCRLLYLIQSVWNIYFNVNVK